MSVDNLPGKGQNATQSVNQWRGIRDCLLVITEH